MHLFRHGRNRNWHRQDLSGAGRVTIEQQGCSVGYDPPDLVDVIPWAARAAPDNSKETR